MYIYLAFFLVLVIFGVRRSKGSEFNSNPLSYDSTVAIRGICAIEIMLGHIGVATNNKWLFANRKAGILIVGVFFLLSGYGLMYSMIHKKNYLNKFIIKRVGAVLLPAYIVYIISMLRRIFILHVKADAAFVVKYIFLVYLPTKANWYITEIIVLYLLFYLIYKFMNKKVGNIVFWVICITFIIGASLAGIDNPWYGSTLCFPLGIMYAQKEEKINCYLKNHYHIKLFATGFVMSVAVLTFFKLGEQSFIGNVVGRNIASVFFCIVVVQILFLYTFGNVVSNFLGKISYEIFLVHPMMIAILAFRNVVINTGFCIVLSCFFGLILHLIVIRILHKKF